MRVHKGGQINNVQFITGGGLQRCHNYIIAVSKYSKSTAASFKRKRNGGCQLIKIEKSRGLVRGGGVEGWIYTKN